MITFKQLLESSSVQMVNLKDISPWEERRGYISMSRYTIDQIKAHIKYKDKRSEPHDFPPIQLEPNPHHIYLQKLNQVFYTGHEKWIIKDGHHRFVAMRELGFDRVPAIINTKSTFKTKP